MSVLCFVSFCLNQSLVFGFTGCGEAKVFCQLGCVQNESVSRRVFTAERYLFRAFLFPMAPKYDEMGEGGRSGFFISISTKFCVCKQSKFFV